MPPDPGRTLAGIRVLEVARLVPGALVGWWLAALGAEVVKVEEPGGGDYLRDIPPYLAGRGMMHQILDSGKKSVALDLGADVDRSRFLELVATADVVIDGNRPDALRRSGIDYRRLCSEHPRLVVCSVTGYGQSGPLARLASHGFSIDTSAGVVPVVENSAGGRELAWELSSTIGIESGVLQAVISVLAALFRREADDVSGARVGGGAWIDVALWDAAVQSNRFAMTWALSGGDRMRMHEGGPLYGPYQCGDDRLIWFAPIEEKFWRRFCSAVDRPDWVSRWAGAGTDAVGFGTADLRRELEVLFRSRSAGEWEELFAREDVPGNLIMEAGEVAQHPHFLARNMADPARTGTAVPTIGAAPVWLAGGRRVGHGLAPAPAVGADTEQVLAEWVGASSNVS